MGFFEDIDFHLIKNCVGPCQITLFSWQLSKTVLAPWVFNRRRTASPIGLAPVISAARLRRYTKQNFDTLVEFCKLYGAPCCYRRFPKHFYRQSPVVEVHLPTGRTIGGSLQTFSRLTLIRIKNSGRHSADWLYMVLTPHRQERITKPSRQVRSPSHSILLPERCFQSEIAIWNAPANS